MTTPVSSTKRFTFTDLDSPFGKAACGGFISAITVQPLDVLKSRTQWHAACTHGKIVPGSFQLFRDIVRNEGSRALWNGFTASALRNCVGSGLYFTFMEYYIGFGVRNLYQQVDVGANGEGASPLRAIFTGAAARASAGLVMHPVSVVKTRMESYAVHGYSGPVEGLYKIFRTERISGLYAGLAATLFRDVPYSGAYLFFYQKFLQLTISDRSAESATKSTGRYPVTTDTAQRFCVGLAAGAAATLTTHPFDVVKTRLQLSSDTRDGGGWKGRGTVLGVLRVLRSIYAQEGVGGAYRGLALRLVRRPVSTAVVWTTYEMLSRGTSLGETLVPGSSERRKS
eukprot:m.1637327 g.1637327  ORF g.1637327 m.1637327 type:complete len:340 (+) comp25724_c0_seq1:307-1326(+)